MTQILSKIQPSKILAIVPMGKEFLFCLSSGACTKVAANSLDDFYVKLGSVDADSISFHYHRGDFQAWIRDIIGDKELADALCFINPALSPENLRQEVRRIVEGRVSQLRNMKAMKSKQ
jgi:hypothetical protein